MTGHKKTLTVHRRRGFYIPDLFSGIFKVARNPVNKSPRRSVIADDTEGQDKLESYNLRSGPKFDMTAGCRDQITP